jgi:hypothetical protein
MKKLEVYPVMLLNKAKDGLLSKWGAWLFLGDSNRPEAINGHHLYLVSDKEIEEEDWVIGKDDKLFRWKTSIYLPNKTAKKVEATTDTSLGLPLIPQLFIEEYVEKRGKIEYVYIQLNSSSEVEMVAQLNTPNYRPEVIILSTKESWNREELKEIARKAFLAGGAFQLEIPESKCFDEWFDKNY